MSDENKQKKRPRKATAFERWARMAGIFDGGSIYQAAAAAWYARTGHEVPDFILNYMDYNEPEFDD